MEAFKIIMTLVISGLIGYFTNFIAVKMLFHPRTEKHIFGKRIPFTPGIIPKNKPRLAKALGNAVGEQLLTGEDLKQALASDKTASAAAERLTKGIFSEQPIGERLEAALGDSAPAARQLAAEKLTATVAGRIKQADISGIVISEGSAAIKEKVAGSMLAMFVNDDLIAQLAAPLADKIDTYIDTNAEPAIARSVNEELDRLLAMSPAELLNSTGVSQERVTAAAAQLIRRAAESSLDDILKSVDIPAIVEERVNAMSVEQVEELVMSVMKHELNAVISLGGLIGVIIGILNVVIQRI